MLSACQHIPKRPTHLYFTDIGTDKLQRCELGKWVLEDLVPKCPEARSLKVDSEEQAVFVAKLDQKLFRCDMGGANPQVLFDGFKLGGYLPKAIDLDRRGRVVYLYCEPILAGRPNVIFRVPYGGGDPELFMKLETPAADIIIDSCKRKIYWFAKTNVDRVWCEDDKTEAVGNEFWCAELKNPEKRTLLIGTEKGIRAVSRAVFDSTHGKVYWTQRDAGWKNDKVRRSDLHGKKIEDIAKNTSPQGEGCDLVNPHGISLDLVGKKVYWANMNLEWLCRTDLDGGKVERLVNTAIPPGTKTHPTALDLGTPK
jgi:hypothetical protein